MVNMLIYLLWTLLVRLGILYSQISTTKIFFQGIYIMVQHGAFLMGFLKNTFKCCSAISLARYAKVTLQMAVPSSLLTALVTRKSEVGSWQILVVILFSY